MVRIQSPHCPPSAFIAYASLTRELPHPHHCRNNYDNEGFTADMSDTYNGTGTFPAVVGYDFTTTVYGECTHPQWKAYRN